VTPGRIGGEQPGNDRCPWANLMIAKGIITDLEKAFELGGNWRRQL